MNHSKKTILITFLKEQRLLTVAAFALGLFSSILTILIPVVIAGSYEVLFKIHSTRARILDFLPFDLHLNFKAYLSFLGTLIFLKALFEFCQRYMSGTLGERLVHSMRNQIFEHQLKVEMEHYDAKGIGKYLLRYSGDLNGLQSYLTTGIIRFSIDLFLICFATGFLFLLEPVLGWILIAGFLVVASGLWFLNQYLYQVSINSRNKKSGLLSFVNTRLMSLLSLKSFNKEVPEIKRYQKRSLGLFNIGKSYQMINSMISTLIPAAGYLMIMVVIIAIYVQKSKGQIFNESALFAAILLIITLLPVMRRVFRVSMVWKKGSISYEKLANLLNLKTEAYLKSRNYKFSDGAIELRAIDFSFQDKKVFAQFSLKIPPRGIYHIKGKSGVGKTTLIKLISGIYYTQNGRILIDAQDTKTVNPKSLRRSISIIGEDWKLYGKTVLESIAYGRSDKYIKKAVLILKELQATIPIDHQLKVSDRIGEFGSILSKSQRSLLLYARAILTKKPIILIEHPFEGLDIKLTQAISQKLNSMKDNCTIVIFSNSFPAETLKVDKCFDLEEINSNRISSISEPHN